MSTTPEILVKKLGEVMREVVGVLIHRAYLKQHLFPIILYNNLWEFILQKNRDTGISVVEYQNYSNYLHKSIIMFLREQRYHVTKRQYPAIADHNKI